MAQGSGTKDDPWVLTTPPGSSEYTMYRDDAADNRGLAAAAFLQQQQQQGGGGGGSSSSGVIEQQHAHRRAVGNTIALFARVVDHQSPALSSRMLRTAPPCGGGCAPAHEIFAAEMASVVGTAPPNDAPMTASAPAFVHSGWSTPAHEWWSELHSTTRTMRPSSCAEPGGGGNHPVVKEKLKAEVPLRREMSDEPVGIGSRATTDTL